MLIKKFSQVLNDLVNYFILGDILLLDTYKKERNLSDNLALEFTTNASGDEVAENGIILPMAGIANYPYTIIFHSNSDSVDLLKEGNQLQLRQNGYVVKVENGVLYLFTWRILEDFTEANLQRLRSNYETQDKPMIHLENGLYEVEIFGGQTLQETEFQDKNGAVISDNGLEPTFEFVLKRNDNAIFTADINYSFTLKSDDY